MSREITIFSGALGLNTVDDPVRIDRSNNGLTDLQVAVNVSIDKSRRINRRAGYASVGSGDFHSLFCGERECFVCKGGSLYQVGSDYALTGVRSGLTGAKLSYAQDGDYTYYSNGANLGYIKGGTSYPWIEEPATVASPPLINKGTNRAASGPVAANHLAIFNGRMLQAQDKTLWWSEQYNYNQYYKAKSFVQFRSNILMVAPVETGVFVSTERRVVFLRGQPDQFVLETKLPYPAVEWTNVSDVPLADIGFDDPGVGVVWVTKEGVVVGTPSGMAANMNRRKIVYPQAAKSGFGYLMGFNYIHGVE